jgi:hypothetical protein
VTLIRCVLHSTGVVKKATIDPRGMNAAESSLPLHMTNDEEGNKKRYVIRGNKNSNPAREGRDAKEMCRR